ncbi:MAG: Uma2 family endonuclease [Okeania sp. SIO3B5]|uniref:Uma2 family endonuclease n=1 Tax=Okeania sp. SIO3B5 TaxID=2607811 RepID=UPI0013FFFB4E|nr:Uma2 family endonuclease [Okeania sp. SIO3B5]NEO55152.1 Uma2 family endonuclease [Okeania sp. SIO3B5]
MTSSTTPEIIYPESDGLPLADNTIQFRFITTIVGGIAGMYKDNPNVFVAGDLFWYPKYRQPWVKQAPDVMVVFGRPQGDRRSYKQWEEDNIPPQVVFEIASPSNSITELEVTKLEFYSEYGAQEYYVYDPDKGRLKGWLRRGEVLTPIEVMEGWISPQLGIRFEKEGKELQIYRPDGERFATYLEILEQKEQERQNAERERQNAERERQNAEQERQNAEQERQNAEREANARQQAEQERNLIAQQQQEAIPRLLNMGLTTKQVADALSLPLAVVEKIGNRE